MNAGLDSEYQSCLDAASRYLSYRSRSELEVRTRLKQRGFGSPSIDRVLQELRKNGVLDDLAFAQFWKENRESFNPRSRALLRRELRAKGIAPHIVAQVVEEVDEEISARRAAQKWARRLAGADYASFRNRLTSFLRRRGFSYVVVEHTVSQLWEEVHDSYA